MARYLYRRAQMKGLLGGSRPWTVIWAALLGLRLLRRVLRDKPEILYREELAPGATLVISTKDRDPRVVQA
ncbi:MAG: hypothetical protein JF603_10610 [Acidobacteria bacterium]|nr:hypothetical protein [Acidobacteriota bacterium]